MSKSDTITFRICAFSTDSKYNVDSILSVFFNKVKCQNINSLREKNIEFDYRYSKSMNLHTNFVQVTNFSRSHNICSCADCILLMVDVENKDNLDELKKIKDYVNSNCIYGKKVYILGLFNDKSKIVHNEKTIKSTFQTDFFSLDFRQICYQNSDEIINEIKQIYSDVLEGKDSMPVGEKDDDLTGEDVQSKSKCIVF